MGAENIRVSRIDESDFRGMEREWNALVDSATVKSIFLTWDWLYHWWLHFKTPDQQLFVVSARDADGALLGLLPCYLRQSRMPWFPPEVRFLGSEVVCSDHLDAILRPERESETLSCIMDFLLGESAPALQFVLTDINSESRTLRELGVIFEKAGGKVVLRKGWVCPYLDLPANVGTTKAILSKNMRSNTQRRSNAFFRNPGARLRLVDSSEHFEESFNSLRSLHQARWNRRGEKGAFASEALRKFHLALGKSMLPKGWIKLYLLELDMKPIAALYCFEYGGKFSFYQGGFDPEQERWSPGLILLGKSLEGALERGNAEYDFLRGVEEYKWRWTKKYRETTDIVAYPANARGHLMYGAARAAGCARRALRRLLGPGSQPAQPLPGKS
jgi:CelD/BcsL family acetyltransferase involved in cellulose biosynthesis